MASGQESPTGAAARQLREMWEHKTGDRLGPSWDPAFMDWIKKWGVGLVADAVQLVAVTGYSEHGEHQQPNFRDVPRFAAVQQADEVERGMLDCYLVRGRMRKKFFCGDSDETILSLLRRALRAGIFGPAMHRAIAENNTLEDCFAEIGIDQIEFRIAMGHPIVDVPTIGCVFIREDEPEWRLWDAYLRRTTGKGAPMNKNFGWFFPTRMPPVDDPPKDRKRYSI